MFPKCRKNKPGSKDEETKHQPRRSSIISEQLQQRTIDIWMGERCTNMQDRALQGQRKATKKVQAPHQHSPPPAPTTREEAGCGRGRGCGLQPRPFLCQGPEKPWHPQVDSSTPGRCADGSLGCESPAEQERREERSGEQSRAEQGSERTGCPRGRAACRARAGAMQRSTLRP